MKLINLFKTATLATAMVCAVGMSNDAHAQLGKKLKDKVAKAASAIEDGAEAGGKAKDIKEAGDPYKEDFTDQTGVSGTYKAINGIAFENAMGAIRSQRTLKVKFTGRDGNTFVNKLEMFYNKEGAKYDFIISDKETKKLGATTYRITEYHSVWLVELEKDVLMRIDNKSTHREVVEGDEKVTDIFAKDPAKLEVYDLETAQAKFEQMMSKGKAKEDEKVRTRLMEYKAYKENLEKVVFVNNYAYFNYQYGDEPSEDPKNFLKTIDMGDNIFLGAYFKEKIGTSCGTDCQLNIVYEMNGKTADRVALRNSSAKWNKMISEKKNVDYFCYNSGHQMFSAKENILDYAFMSVLYANKPTFKEGQTYKMTVKIYSNRDGNNEAQIAEGTINFVYKAAKMERWFGSYRDWDEE